MENEYELQLAAILAKGMAIMCFRNTVMEDFHSGIAPVSHTGDFSDVVVIDAKGRRIPWPEVAHIEPDEMRALMREVVNGLYTCHLKAGDPEFLGMLDWAARGRGVGRAGAGRGNAEGARSKTNARAGIRGAR